MYFGVCSFVCFLAKSITSPDKIRPRKEQVNNGYFTGKKLPLPYHPFPSLEGRVNMVCLCEGWLCYVRQKLVVCKFNAGKRNVFEWKRVQKVV